MIFRKDGRISSTDILVWGNEVIETVKTYTYLGVVFSSNSLFTQQAKLAKEKGKKAINNIWSVLVKGRIHEPDSRMKIFNAMVDSTTLYAAAIWGSCHTALLEEVQQYFLKKSYKLPKTAPQYFVRLETGCNHVKLKVFANLIKFWIRILNKPENSIVKASYYSIRGIKSKHEIYNWSWQARIQENLPVLTR